jgi:hypothetical protein
MAPMAGIEPVTGAFVTQQIGCVGAVQIIHTCASSMRTSTSSLVTLGSVAVARAVLTSAAHPRMQLCGLLAQPARQQAVPVSKTIGRAPYPLGRLPTCPVARRSQCDVSRYPG